MRPRGTRSMVGRMIDDPGSKRWYRQAVVYCADVDSYSDSDGDGCGDFQGMRSRLPHLARLGITCLWLNPIHPTPHRDDGYDVSDYYGVDPRLGSLGDFVELLPEAAPPLRGARPGARLAGRLRRAPARARRPRHPGHHRPRRHPPPRPAPLVPV